MPFCFLSLFTQSIKFWWLYYRWFCYLNLSSIPQNGIPVNPMWERSRSSMFTHLTNFCVFLSDGMVWHHCKRYRAWILKKVNKSWGILMIPVRGLVLTSPGIRLRVPHPSNISFTDLSLHYSWSVFYSLVMAHRAQNKEHRSAPDKCSDESIPVHQRQDQGTHLAQKRLKANVPTSLEHHWIYPQTSAYYG